MRVVANQGTKNLEMKQIILGGLDWALRGNTGQAFHGCMCTIGTTARP